MTFKSEASDDGGFFDTYQCNGKKCSEVISCIRDGFMDQKLVLSWFGWIDIEDEKHYCIKCQEDYKKRKSTQQ